MRVLCTLPNASTVINGVTFEAGPYGLVSADLTPEMARHFASIPGYSLYPSAPSVDPTAPAEAEGNAPDQPAPARRTRPRTPR